MYDYSYDLETGGILLNDKTVITSKEPRPVYAKELDYLGVDSIWHYDKQQDTPYMWAEANHYIYKGLNIFNVSGGTLVEKPKVEVTYLKNESGELTNKYALEPGTVLEPINIELMCKKNRDILDIVEQITVKKIFGVYKKYQKQLDCFHVAFSGGKDSIVLLELVKKALPRSSFIVIFGDTKMEFPDTYELVRVVEMQCKNDGINFYRAKSHFEPEESWHRFGPPSRTLRWCCTVHKAVPQTLKIREILEKDDYVGLDFVGIRAQESVARSNYEMEGYGKKQKGQYSHNSILDWSSAEIWLYIYTHKLPINETYKKGNSRAGCLLCPMGGGKGDFFQYASYKNEIDNYLKIIKEMNARDQGNERALNSYVINGGWNARKNGRDLTIGNQRYFEEIKDGKLIIRIVSPLTDWKEWIKTLGILEFNYNVEEIGDEVRIIVNESAFGRNVTLKRKFKQVFKKAAYCIKCRACEMNCRYGRLTFKEGLKIDDCLHCGQCHEIESGCLVYNSLKMPQGGTIKMKSINSFANHAPKPEWIKDFMQKGNAFWTDNKLGPNQIPMFRKFLKACGFIDEKNELTKLFNLLVRKGYQSPIPWSVAFVNFSYNAQCFWYINNMTVNTPYQRDQIAEKLVEEGVSKGDTTSIISSFKRFCEIPFGSVINFGTVTTKGNRIEYITRNKMSLIDPKAVLYSLYRYAEECGGYYQFTLRTIMDNEINSTGISPVKMFGFEQDEMESIVQGLAAKYNDFIDASFTHDLDKITLRDYYSSNDILKLFEEV